MSKEPGCEYKVHKELSNGRVEAFVLGIKEK
jgi:hypothetical protein